MFLPYWAQAVRHANRETLALLGHGHPWRLVVGPIVFTIALLLIWKISGKDQMADEWHWGVAVVLAAAVAYVPLFVFNLIRAPDRIDQDKQRRIDELGAGPPFSEEVAERLEELTRSAEALFLQKISVDDVEEWCGQVDRWYQQTLSCIRDDVGRDEGYMFETLDTHNAGDWGRGTNKKHNDVLSKLNAKRQKLRLITSRYLQRERRGSG